MVAGRQIGFAFAASALLAVLLSLALTRVTSLSHQALVGAIQDARSSKITAQVEVGNDDIPVLDVSDTAAELDQDETEDDSAGDTSEHERQLLQYDDEDDAPRVRKRKRKRAAASGGGAGDGGSAAAGGGGGVVSTISKWLGANSDVPKGEQVLPRMQRPLVRRGGGDDVAAGAGGEDGGGRLRRKKKKKKKKGFMGKKKRAMGGGDGYGGGADRDEVQDLYR